MARSKYLFVYGTLLDRVDTDMSRFLSEHSEFIGKGHFRGKLYLASWYPGAILSEDKGDKVFGRIYKLKDEERVFKVLDAYEGVEDGLYSREIIDVYVQDHPIYKSWVYLYNLPITDLKRIASGDFLKQ